MPFNPGPGDPRHTPTFTNAQDFQAYLSANPQILGSGSVMRGMPQNIGGVTGQPTLGSFINGPNGEIAGVTRGMPGGQTPQANPFAGAMQQPAQMPSYQQPQQAAPQWQGHNGGFTQGHQSPLLGQLYGGWQGHQQQGMMQQRPMQQARPQSMGSYASPLPQMGG